MARSTIVLRHDEPVAEVELVEPEQLVIAPIPLTRLQVVGQKLQGVFDHILAEDGEPGDAGADVRVEVRLRTPPVGREEPIVAVVRNWDRYDSCGTEERQRWLGGR